MNAAEVLTAFRRLSSHCRRVPRIDSGLVVCQDDIPDITIIPRPLQENNMSNKAFGVLSTVCFVAGFASIVLALLVWFFQGPDAAHGERLAIFIGLWAPAFFALSGRLERYAAVAHLAA